MQPSQPQPPKSSSDPKADSSALWALIVGALVLIYHAYIAIAKPDNITVFWYLAILPIILGIMGIKSQKRRPFAIAGLVLGVIAIIVFFAAIMLAYKF